MSVNEYSLGTVSNPARERRDVTVVGPILILGGAAVGTYVGLQIGGPQGAAVGALVGAFVGSLAALVVEEVEFTLHPDGRVTARVKYY